MKINKGIAKLHYLTYIYIVTLLLGALYILFVRIKAVESDIYRLYELNAKLAKRIYDVNTNMTLRIDNLQFQSYEVRLANTNGVNRID